MNPDYLLPPERNFALKNGMENHGWVIRANMPQYSVCMGIQCQIISVKFKFSNICELKPYGTRKKILLMKFEII